MKRVFALVLALALTLTAFTACGGSKPSGSTTTPAASAEPTPEPTPVYDPDPLTGREKPAGFNGGRPVAIMINNIQQCRPQRGLNEAKVLYESKVEGGITRFMGLFEDYENLPDIGPVRSARDQFFRVIMPFQPLYVHIGRSGITQQYIDDADYGDLNVDGNDTTITYWDQNRRNQGFAQEHTAYTNSEWLQKYVDKKGIDMDRELTSPIFDFVNYNEPVRALGGEAATSIGITHSQSYRTYFDYDTATSKYMMSQYSSARGVTPTVDENDKEQVGFNNVFVLFADISAYPYPGGNLDKNGNDKGDSDYQKVDYTFGGLGYYFNNGKCEKIRWFKGATNEVLRFTDESGSSSLKINPGTSYVGIVDLDEYEKFEYTGPETDASISAPAANPDAAASDAAAEKVAE